MDPVRLFVSIEVPRLGALESVAEDIGGIRGARPVPDKQRHLTLAFIGDLDAEYSDRVCEAVERAAEGIGPFRIDLRGIGAFPNPQKPKVVWVGANDDGSMAALAYAVRRSLDAAGVGYDGKEFRPHITLARMSGGTDVGGLVAGNKSATYGWFNCDSINVMSSTLRPSEAVHTLVKRIPLKG
jgi:2'-5' RNA ligase